MPSLKRKRRRLFENYHETQKFRATLRRSLRTDEKEDAALAAPEFFRLSTRLVQGALREALEAKTDLRPVGGSWTFNDLIATKGAVLHTNKWRRAFSVAPGDLHKAAGVDAGRIALASGGMTLAWLNRWLEDRALSLRTSGASNGQTIAGALATGTHGSVIECGGFQDHLRGVQLIVSPEKSVWLERKSAPLFADGFAGRLGDEVVRDDTLFEAACVHLGGLGVVGAVALEAAPIFWLEVVQNKSMIERADIERLQNDDFRSLARQFEVDETPYFYQMILSPFPVSTGTAQTRWPRKALHRFLFKRDKTPKLLALGLGRLIEPLNLLALYIGDNDRRRAKVIPKMMDWAFKTIPAGGEPRDWLVWGATTPRHRYLGDLFSSGIAIERGRLLEALEVMLDAFGKEQGDVVFTLRFVKKSAGLTAFTRFENTVVVDLDGLRTKASERAFAAVLAALRTRNIPFFQHWGKFNDLDPVKVDAGYGGAAGAYRNARAVLLPPAMRRYFASTGLDRLGLAREPASPPPAPSRRKPAREPA